MVIKVSLSAFMYFLVPDLLFQVTHSLYNYCRLLEQGLVEIFTSIVPLSSKSASESCILSSYFLITSLQHDL